MSFCEIDVLDSQRFTPMISTYLSPGYHCVSVDGVLRCCAGAVHTHIRLLSWWRTASWSYRSFHNSVKWRAVFLVHHRFGLCEANGLKITVIPACRSLSQCFANFSMSERRN